MMSLKSYILLPIRWLARRNLPVKLLLLIGVGSLVAGSVIAGNLVYRSNARQADNQHQGASRDHPKRPNLFGAIASTLTGGLQTPSSSNAGKSPSPIGPTRHTITSTTGQTAAAKDATSAPQSSNSPQQVGTHTYTLVLAQTDLVMAGGGIDTPNFSVATEAKAASGVELSNPTFTGPSGPINVYALPLMEKCPTYSGLNQMCSAWAIRGHRLRPEGNGVSSYTVSAYDKAGNLYTSRLTITWKPIPYFTLVPGRTELAYGNSPQWGDLVAIVVHATIKPTNMINTQLWFNKSSFPSNYDCHYSGVYPEQFPYTRQYDGNNDVAIACWMYANQIEELRGQSGTATIVVESGLFTEFNAQSISVAIPPR